MDNPDAVSKRTGALDDLKDRVPVGLFRFREAGIAVAFLLLCVFFWWQKQDVFLRPANLAVIMRFIAIYGILAIGELLVIITGGIDLSVGSMTALTGVLVATLMMKGVEAVPAPATVPAIVFALVFLGLLAFWRGIVVPRLRVPPLGNTLGTVLIVLVGLLVVIWAVVNGFGAIPPLDILPSILIVLVFAGLVGLWHGLFVTKLHIPPFIITLGTWLMASGLAALITRGYPIVFPTGFSFLSLGQGEVTLGGESGLQLPNMFLVLMAAAVLVSFILSITTTGRHIYAVGGDIEASRVSGINVDRVRIFCYITSGVMAGLVGILLASRLGEGTPTVGQTYELWAIAATVIGGTSLFGGEGSVLGVILGAAIMGVMSNGMVLINVSSYIQQIVLGVVLVVAVTYDMWRRRRQS